VQILPSSHSSKAKFPLFECKFQKKMSEGCEKSVAKTEKSFSSSNFLEFFFNSKDKKFFFGKIKSVLSNDNKTKVSPIVGERFGLLLVGKPPAVVCCMTHDIL
jgi:hypothetical protein